MKTILGLPAHPLLVHGAVVLLPLAVLAVLVYVLAPRVRDRFYPVLVGVVPLAMLFVVLASGSGEALQANVPRAHLVREHTQAAGLLQTISWVFTVAFLLLVAVEWNARRSRAGTTSGASAPTGATTAVAPKAITLPLRILLVALALGVGFQIAVVGHSGAKSVWHKQKMTRSSPA